MRIKVGDRVKVVRITTDWPYGELSSSDYIGEKGNVISVGRNEEYPYQVEFDNSNIKAMLFKEEEIVKIEEILNKKVHVVKFNEVDVYEAARLVRSKHVVYYTRGLDNPLWILTDKNFVHCLAEEETIYLTQCEEISVVEESER